MQWRVKRGEIVKTNIGDRYKCPYCHLLLDPNEVVFEGKDKMCYLCGKSFEIRGDRNGGV